MRSSAWRCELARDLLRRLRIVPEGRGGCLVLQGSDLGPHLVEVKDGLDRPHGRGKGLQLFGYIDDCHAPSLTADGPNPAADPRGTVRPRTPGGPVVPSIAGRAGYAPARRAGPTGRGRRRCRARGGQLRAVAARRQPAPDAEDGDQQDSRHAQRDTPLADGLRLVPGRARPALARRARRPGRAARAAREFVGGGNAHARVGVAVGVRRRSGRAGRPPCGAAARPPGHARPPRRRTPAPPRSARRRARPPPGRGCRRAAEAARGAARPARRRAAGRPGPWPGTGRGAATARRECRGAARRSR